MWNKRDDETAESSPAQRFFTSFISPSRSSQTNFGNLYFPLELSTVFFSVCFNCIILSGMVPCPFSSFHLLYCWESFPEVYLRQCPFYYSLILKKQTMAIFINSTVFFLVDCQFYLSYLFYGYLFLCYSLGCKYEFWSQMARF